MTCLIYSEAKDIPIDFWNYLNISSKPGKFNYMSLDNAKINKVNKRNGEGFFVKIDGNIFVITCFHIIEKNNVKCKIYYYDKNNILQYQNAKIKFMLDEFDIAVLEPENTDIIDMDNIYDSKIFDLKLSLIKTKINSNVNIEVIDFKNSDFLNVKNKKFIKNINGVFKSIDEKKIISPIDLCFDAIPCINIEINSNNESQNEKYNGLSGSLVKINNDPISMIIRTENKDKNCNNLVSLPICFIGYLIKNSLVKKKYLSSIIFDNEVCEIEFDNKLKYENNKIKEKLSKKRKCGENGNIYDGLIITNSFDIAYKKIKTSHKFKFFKDDIILMINNKFIENDGKVYCDILEYYVNISTYCMIHSYFDDKFNIVIMRTIYENNDKILGQKDIVFEININSISVNHILPYNLNTNSYVISYEGFIFIELSDKLLEYFKKQKIFLCEALEVIKTDKINKYIVLVHVDYNYIENEFKRGCNDMKKINFPYANNKILILNKIGNENITDLNSLRGILLKRQSDKQTTYNYNNSNNNETSCSITLESKIREITMFLKFNY